MKLPSKEVDYIKYIFHLLSRTMGLERPKGGFGNVAWPGRAELICIKEKLEFPRTFSKYCPWISSMGNTWELGPTLNLLD